MSIEQKYDYPNIRTIAKDGRKSLRELYNENFFRLAKDGWSVEEVFRQKIEIDGEVFELPILAFLSPNPKNQPLDSLWVLNGMHGEEPAPVHAQANKIDTIRALPDQGIPVAAIFMINAVGYSLNWRYPNLEMYQPIFHNFPPNKGKSVGDFDHLLPNVRIPYFPRKFRPSSKYAATFSSWIAKKTQTYKPIMVVHHHEDVFIKNNRIRDSEFFYAYAYGDPKALAILCPVVTNILEKSGYSMEKGEKTRYGEKIKDGWVINSPDGSTDDFLASHTIMRGFKKENKEAAKAVLVPETVIHYEHPQSIAERSAIHGDIIDSYKELWELLKEI